MKKFVQTAIKELEDGLPDAKVTARDDGDGGAHVLVEDVDFGEAFAPRKSWIGFHVTWSPDADVYPHFIDPAVQYVGSGATPNQHPDGNLPAAMTRGMSLPGFDKPAIQVSQRSNRRNAETDSALQKLLRVLKFLRTR